MKSLFRQGMAMFVSWCLLLVGTGDAFANQTNGPSQPP
jgi:hypothetical protein